MENTWTKPRRGGSKVGGGDDWGGGSVVGGKWIQLYLKNNKKSKKKILFKGPLW